MSDTTRTIAELRTRKVATAERKRLANATAEEHEVKGRAARAEAFAAKKEEEEIDAALRSHNATLIEEQAVSAAKKAQQDAEAARTEATTARDQVNAKQAELDAKLKQADELLAKLSKRTAEEEDARNE